MTFETLITILTIENLSSIISDSVTKVGIELLGQLKTDEMVGDCFPYTIPTFPQNGNHVHIQVVSRSVDQVGFQKILRISTL